MYVYIYVGTYSKNKHRKSVVITNAQEGRAAVLT